MQKITLFIVSIFCLCILASYQPSSRQDWISLFDGQSLNGWTVGDNATSFSVKEGAIVVNGEVAHLYYTGSVNNHMFKNFEFKVDIMTLPGSNSGVYIQTEYKKGGWPEKGYEVQVNNSHTDWRRTGSLWAIQDLKEVFVKDREWFTMRIVVMDKNIKVYINEQLVNDYTEPANVQRNENMRGRLLDRGTFALQGHDPNSTVHYKNIMVKPLAD